MPTALGYAPAWAPPAHDDFAVVLDLPRLSTTVLALTIVFAILLYLRREPRPATTRPRLRNIVTGSSGMLCGGASGLVLAEAYREPLAVALCMAILGAIAWGAVWTWLVTAAFRDIVRGGLYGGAAAYIVIHGAVVIVSPDPAPATFVGAILSNGIIGATIGLGIGICAGAIVGLAGACRDARLLWAMVR